MAYLIPPSRIVYEVLNTEVIVVDFSTGNYYALIHVAKQVWQLIEQGACLTEIAKCLADRYGLDFQVALADVERFISQLIENKLIELTPHPSAVDLCQNSFNNRDFAKEGPEEVAFESHFPSRFNIIFSESVGWEYDPPKLEIYTDVQSLLLIDPVHEVTEAGWPVQSNDHHASL